jgi:hypothetical protein
MILHAIGGLCNRLQAILSYRAVYGSVDVVWRADEYVSNAEFTDVLLPIESVCFLSDRSRWDSEDWNVHPSAPALWQNGYAELKPVTEIEERLIQLRRALLGEAYLAVHARRTDHTPNMTTAGWHLTTDEELFNFVGQWPDLPIYLATDNGDTQARWLKNPRVRVGHSLPGTELQGLTDHHRNGTLTEAVVDLFICRDAKHFMGTKHSSFSETIDRLRSASCQVQA